MDKKEIFKKTYKKPKLSIYGSIIGLTMGNDPEGMSDGEFPNMHDS